MRFSKILASDLDGTLIPLGKPFDAGSIGRFALARLQNPKTALIYVTGRHLSLALTGIRKWGLPEPDFFITDVGTRIWQKKGGKWRESPSWRKKLSRAWKGRLRQQIAALLNNCPGIRPQQAAKQSAFKQSYYASARDGKGAHHVKQILHAAGVQATVVFSLDETKKKGLLDVLPKNAEKDAALDFLCRRLRLKNSDVAYAGDSGNDLSALTFGFWGIVVANASAAFKRELRAVARHKKANRLFFATRPYADGVIQGATRCGVFA